MIESWLLAHLVTTGVLPANGATTRARVRRCARCASPVLRGWTSEPCSEFVVADVTPVGPAGELDALLSGLATFDLALLGGRLSLEWRESHSVASRPAGTVVGWDVLVEHRCGRPVQGAIPSRQRPPPQSRSLPDHPPF